MYQSLYRKYRPHNFNSIVGQDIVIKTLKNSIKNNKISHAYLLIGPRGTGKTSTAKILARAVNCQNNCEGDLCDECESCIISSQNECLDIIEIDAASNNGVDEIRNLKEKVSLMPSQLKYKVYIIDEVHMLTIQAFNALLKTLEEPPEHIIFILATTDPQKVPETIISRCQCFNFLRITEENIIKNLLMISEKEKILINSDVLKQIALVSDGGMRDSIGMLDKLNSYVDGDIELDDFLKLNGLVMTSDLDILLNCIIKNDVEECINLLEEWNSKGRSLIQIMVQLLNYIKDILIKKYIEKNVSAETDIYQYLANLINEKMFEIKKSSNPKIYIEIMLLNFMNNNKIISREIISDNSVLKDNIKIVSRETINVSDIKKNSLKKNKTINSDYNLKPIESKVLNSNIKEIMKVRINNTFLSATKDMLINDKNSFVKLNDYTFDQNIGYLVCALLDGKLRLSNEKNLVISYEYNSVVNDNLEKIFDMENTLNKLLDINKKLVLISDEEWNIIAKNYVDNKKNGIIYEYKTEPELMFEKNKKNEKNNNNNSALDIFGDIVEEY